MPCADYEVQGIATSNFVDDFYRTRFSQPPAALGNTFQAQASFQRLAGDAESIGGLALLLGENLVGDYFGFDATANAKAAENLT